MSKPPEVTPGTLDAIALVRKRPGMYVGYVGAPPVAHFGEVLANAMDQALADRARTIEVILREDDSVEIRDDGPGAAREIFERALSGIHDTPTLDGHRPHVHLALVRVGERLQISHRPRVPEADQQSWLRHNPHVAEIHLGRHGRTGRTRTEGLQQPEPVFTVNPKRLRGGHAQQNWPRFRQEWLPKSIESRGGRAS